MDATQALADLTEISSQIEAAVVLGADGATLAATLDENRSRELAQAAQELVAAAGRASGDGGRQLAQLEVSTREGSVFVVRDEQRTIAATTGPEPTVGLVFYDLKSCLRSIAAGEKPKPKRASRKDAPAEQGDGAA
jgi:predicted regulator of Ras-like GTPase activity (Roadblock/LC7/MglB family)